MSSANTSVETLLVKRNQVDSLTEKVPGLLEPYVSSCIETNTGSKVYFIKVAE